MSSLGTSTRDGQVDQGNSVYAALARTATRTAALYFSRPVRLFRPSKGESSTTASLYLSVSDTVH